MKNCGRFLPEAINSILAQTFSTFELLIIDDGSSDGSDRYARDVASRDSRVRVEATGGLGLVHALNYGLQLARGELVARMDGDDVSVVTRFERQVAFLTANPSVALVGGGVVVIDEEGHHGRRLYPPVCGQRIRQALEELRLGIVHPSVMYRRGVITACKGYRAQFPLGEDLDLWLRVSETQGLANLDEVVLYLRKHSGNTSRHRCRQQMVFAIVALAMAKMRRMGAGDIADVEPCRFAKAVAKAEQMIDTARIVEDLAARAAAAEAIRSVVRGTAWQWPAAQRVLIGPRTLFVRRRTVRLADELARWIETA
jgi:glycosyltransferase involved in cell wall biosynthesis